MGRKLLISMIAALAVLSYTGLAGTASAKPDGMPEKARPEAMTLLQAAGLGIVEGITEYLPVGAAGHLMLAEKIMGIGDDSCTPPDRKRPAEDAAAAYALCIRAGAFLAVIWLYFQRIEQIFRGLTGKDAAGRRLLVNVVAGFLPAAVSGLLLNNRMPRSFFSGLWPVAAAWLLGGLAILAVNRYKHIGSPHKRPGPSGRPLDGMTWRAALCIGLAQGLAIWPGTGRSLIILLGGLLAGLSLEASAEYSFLLGAATLGASTAYDALKHGRRMLQTFDHPLLILGLAAAFFAALISVKWMVHHLPRHGLKGFAYYRMILAGLAAVYLLTMKMIWI